MWFQQNGMVANPDKYQALVLGNTTHDFDIKKQRRTHTCFQRDTAIERNIG